MGHARQVIDDVGRLMDHMNTLPAVPGSDEAVHRWAVRESLLDTGYHAAFLLGRYQDALDFNAARIISMRDRHATVADTIRARFNDHGPLLFLGRTDEALALLLDCRQAFHDTHDVQGLGKTLGALAHVEYERGHDAAAIRLERDSLRYSYLTGEVCDIASGYHKLGTYLCKHDRQSTRKHGRQFTPAMVSHLSAALIRALARAEGSARSIHAAAADLRELGTAAEPPANVADLCRRIGDIPGTDPARLVAKLSPDPETAERMLQGITALTQELASHDTPSAGCGV